MKNFKFAVAATIVLLLQFSCSNTEELLENEQLVEFPLIDLQNLKHDHNCGYINGDWGPSAYYDYFIIDQEQTNYLYGQNARAGSVFGLGVIPLAIVHDPNGSSFGAFSYSAQNPKAAKKTGVIMFGEDLYRNALDVYGPDAIAFIQAHELAHQVQYKHVTIPSNNSTDRTDELEADGFAGYYIRLPSGLNLSWEAAAPMFNLAFELGSLGNPNTHGTAPQRRAASRIGWRLGEYCAQRSIVFNVHQIDRSFFAYYNQYVLTGTGRVNINKPDGLPDDLHEFMLADIDNVRKIYNNEISKAEFELLAD